MNSRALCNESRLLTNEIIVKIRFSRIVVLRWTLCHNTVNGVSVLNFLCYLYVNIFVYMLRFNFLLILYDLYSFFYLPILFVLNVILIFVWLTCHSTHSMAYRDWVKPSDQVNNANSINNIAHHFPRNNLYIIVLEQNVHWATWHVLFIKNMCMSSH